MPPELNAQNPQLLGLEKVAEGLGLAKTVLSDDRARRLQETNKGAQIVSQSAENDSNKKVPPSV